MSVGSVGVVIMREGAGLSLSLLLLVVLFGLGGSSFWGLGLEARKQLSDEPIVLAVGEWVEVVGGWVVCERLLCLCFGCVDGSWESDV